MIDRRLNISLVHFLRPTTLNGRYFVAEEMIQSTPIKLNSLAGANFNLNSCAKLGDNKEIRLLNGCQCKQIVPCEKHSSLPFHHSRFFFSSEIRCLFIADKHFD
jgi:hypothetical protein